MLNLEQEADFDLEEELDAQMEEEEAPGEPLKLLPRVRKRADG